jgi:hypothetical protein
METILTVSPLVAACPIAKLRAYQVSLPPYGPNPCPHPPSLANALYPWI